MIEVNYQCSPCRPFTGEAPCATCLESQLEITKLKLWIYKHDFKHLADSDVNDKCDNVFSVFSESEVVEADTEENRDDLVSVFSEYELVFPDNDEFIDLEGIADGL
jgi:hypothetical protein